MCVVLRVERSSRRSPSLPALSSRGGCVWGGGVPHAKHTKPQLRRGARLRGGGEVAGEVERGGGCAEFEGGDEAGGVAGCGRQHHGVRE